MTQKTQIGRSMIEMLGVLAIIGVLSVGGLAGYTRAMRAHRVNEILDYTNRAWIEQRALGTGLTKVCEDLTDEDLPSGIGDMCECIGYSCYIMLESSIAEAFEAKTGAHSPSIHKYIYDGSSWSGDDNL